MRGCQLDIYVGLFPWSQLAMPPRAWCVTQCWERDPHSSLSVQLALVSITQTWLTACPYSWSPPPGQLIACDPNSDPIHMAGIARPHPEQSHFYQIWHRVVPRSWRHKAKFFTLTFSHEYTQVIIFQQWYDISSTVFVNISHQECTLSICPSLVMLIIHTVKRQTIQTSKCLETISFDSNNHSLKEY